MTTEADQVQALALQSFILNRFVGIIRDQLPAVLGNMSLDQLRAMGAVIENPVNVDVATSVRDGAITAMSVTPAP